MRPIVLLLTFFISLQLKAAELILVGSYQGKNLYVQNPLLEDGASYSAGDIFVNQNLVMHAPRASAFVIDLSHLSINQKVEVKIMHQGAKPPKIVNAHAIRNYTIYLDDSYAAKIDVFRWVKADADTLRWSVHNQKLAGIFVVQKANEDDWENLDSIKVTRQGIYRVSAHHETGSNTYRIKLIDRDGYVSYSGNYDFQKAPEQQQFYRAKPKNWEDKLSGISYFPKRAQRTIRLSKETAYEIWDDRNKLFPGEGYLIDISNLAPGTYYIKIGKERGAFVKY